MMRSPRGSWRFWGRSGSRYLVATAVILAVLTISTGIVLTRQSSNSMLRVMEMEGIALTESLILASQAMLESGRTFEDLMIERLRDSARIVNRLDRTVGLTDEDLAAIAFEHDLSAISILQASGVVVQSSPGAPPPPVDDEELRAVLSGEVHEGIVDLPDGVMVGVAIPRSRLPGAVICYIDARTIKDFRRGTGIGRLVQQMSRERGIEYIVLQDEDGIVFASKNIERMRRIDADPFLTEVLHSREPKVRIEPFEARSVLEIARPFFLEEELFGIFRVALSLEGYQETAATMRRHVAVLMGIVFILGAVGLGFIVVSQNYSVLRQSFEEMRSLTGGLLDSMPSGVVAIDALGRITIINQMAGRIFSLSSSSVLGRPYGEVFPHDECLLEETIAGGRAITDAERVYRSLSKGQLVLSLSTSPLTSEEGSLDGAFCLVRDVTDVKRLEESVQRQERLSALGDLAAGVAHEIRNPLNAIAVTAQRLEEEFQPADRRQEFVRFTQAIRNEISRLNRIVQQFLSLARPVSLNLVPIDVNAMVEDLLATVEQEAAVQGVMVKRKLQFGDAPLELDGDRVKQALLNVIRNAIEAMPNGGTLIVSTRTHDHTCEIQIEDTGCGIPKADLPKVFRPYFGTKESSTGLGLAISQRVITEHRGSIEIESTEGVGTTVTIHLPVEQKDGSTA
jgi:two-component system sensor histidine kinase HydH